MPTPTNEDKIAASDAYSREYGKDLCWLIFKALAEDHWGKSWRLQVSETSSPPHGAIERG